MAIIFVLVAHGLDGTNPINITLYAFHMPLFFIISGMLIREKTLSLSIKQIFLKYLQSLLVPYYTISLLTVFVEIIKNIIQQDISILGCIQLFAQALLWQGIKADWFLPCLFLSIFVAVILLKLISEVFVLAITMILALFVSIAIPQITGGFWVDELFVFFRVAISLFFVVLGYCLKSYYIENIKLNKRTEFIIGLICLAIFIFLTFYNGKVSLKNWIFGQSSVAYILDSIVGSLFVISMTRLINRNNIPMLKYCGKNSMIIMGIHMEIMAFVGVITETIIGYNNSVFYAIRILATFVITLILIPLASIIIGCVNNMINNAIVITGREKCVEK